MEEIGVMCNVRYSLHFFFVVGTQFNLIRVPVFWCTLGMSLKSHIWDVFFLKCV